MTTLAPLPYDAFSQENVCASLGIDIPEHKLTVDAIRYIHALNEKGCVTFSTDDGPTDTLDVMREVADIGGHDFFTDEGGHEHTVIDRERFRV